jgi:tRNA1(Val) A37 N6-methylase TrmN6
MDNRLLPSERLDDLMTHSLQIIQSQEVFSFSMDAVLLARFATLPKRGKIMDLCTGNGVIPLLLSTRTKAEIHGLELQARLADMAMRSVLHNRLEHQIHIQQGDLKNAVELYGRGQFDVVTVNPPYMPVTQSEINENEHFALARHELACTLEDVVRCSAAMVRSGGKVSLVHRPTRLAEIVEVCRKYRLEPKRIRLVHPREDQEANMLLMECHRDGSPEVRMLPPLIVYNTDGQYHPEIYAIYNGERDGE